MAFRHSPFEQMNRLMNEMDQMMAQMRRGAWGQGYPALTDGSETDSTSASDLVTWQDSGLHMSVDATEDGYRIVADVPGFETEELDLSFDEDDRVLRITGTHEEGDESSSHSRRISEYMTIPGEAPVLVEDIDATYRNGVLEVHFPTEAAHDENNRTHRIDIN